MCLLDLIKMRYVYLRLAQWLYKDKLFVKVIYFNGFGYVNVENKADTEMV